MWISSHIIQRRLSTLDLGHCLVFYILNNNSWKVHCDKDIDSLLLITDASSVIRDEHALLLHPPNLPKLRHGVVPGRSCVHSFQIWSLYTIPALSTITLEILLMRRWLAPLLKYAGLLEAGVELRTETRPWWSCYDTYPCATVTC